MNLRKLQQWQVTWDQKRARLVVEFARRRRRKILQGVKKVCFNPQLTKPIRFFFGILAENERQAPCCTFTDGEEVQSEEASEPNECRQCSEEERRFPRLATTHLAPLTSLTQGSSLGLLTVTASYHVVQRLKNHLRMKIHRLKRHQQKFLTPVDNVQMKKLDLAGGLSLVINIVN